MKPIKISVLLLGDLPSDHLATLAGRIEDWGYDYLWCADERFFREVYSSLTLCALNTNRISLGPCVTDPYSRHPALTAMAISTLDEISGGRAVLGLGAGVSGFAAMGVDRSRPALAIRESVTLIRALLTGQSVDFQGRTVGFHEGELNFTPPRSDLPIYIASNSSRGLQVAGELGDGAIISSCAIEASVNHALSMVSQGTSKAGRELSSLDLVARLSCCISSDSGEAIDALRVSATRSLLSNAHFAVASGIDVPSKLIQALAAAGYTHDQRSLNELAQQVPDDLVDATTLSGTVEDAAARVLSLVRAGISQIIIRPSPTVKQGVEATLEAFATQVMPTVRQQLA